MIDHATPTPLHGAFARGRGFALTLLALALALAWIGSLAQERIVAATWSLRNGESTLTLQASSMPALRAHVGMNLVAIRAEGQPAAAAVPVSADSHRRSAEWLLSDDARLRSLRAQESLGRVLRAPRVVLTLASDGRLGASRQVEVAVATELRGLGRLGLWVWLTLATAMMLLAAVITLWVGGAHRSALSMAAIAAAAAPKLLLIGPELTPQLGSWQAEIGTDLMLRTASVSLMLAGVLDGFARIPRAGQPLQPLVRPWWMAMLCLAVAEALAQSQGQVLSGLPWMVILATMLCFAGYSWASFLAWRKYGRALLRQQSRLVASGLATFALVVVANALAQAHGAAAALLATQGNAVWYLFSMMLILAMPFLLRVPRAGREFVVLAGALSAAGSALVLLTTLELPMGIALVMALAVATLALRIGRRWIIHTMSGAAGAPSDRLFEHLYRAARGIEADPAQGAQWLGRLLDKVFSPRRIEEVHDGSQLGGTPTLHALRDGSALIVPVPTFAPPLAPSWLVLHHPQQGSRLFTEADRQLVERLLSQLQRAVSYDRAVEQGRNEERMRIAQDLHDDIGARLLTLMYRAPTAEVESYVRHTLQDLKTLTRGLGTQQHLLEDAAAEWKNDLTQRLATGGIKLDWQFEADANPLLTVVQWSALTRILRELSSNVIAHAGARCLRIEARLAAGQLELIVADDGVGSDPAHWKIGLGVGGVRKRVRHLGGQVRWAQRAEGGVRCEIRCPLGEVEPAAGNGAARPQPG